MHHLYQTKAYVLGLAPTGEANMMCRIFTRDLGYVPAFAQGVRLAKSKMAAHLVMGNFVQVSLVKGKELWRLVGVRELDAVASHLDSLMPEERLRIRAFWARLARFLNRFMQGEEQHAAAFDDLEQVRILATQDFVQRERSLETLFVFRSMFRLGYIAPGDLGAFVEGGIDSDALNRFVAHQHAALALINKALKESHL